MPSGYESNEAKMDLGYAWSEGGGGYSEEHEYHSLESKKAGKLVLHTTATHGQPLKTHSKSPEVTYAIEIAKVIAFIKENGQRL